MGSHGTGEHTRLARGEVAITISPGLEYWPCEIALERILYIVGSAGKFGPIRNPG